MNFMVPSPKATGESAFLRLCQFLEEVCTLMGYIPKRCNRYFDSPTLQSGSKIRATPRLCCSPTQGSISNDERCIESNKTHELKGARLRIQLGEMRSIQICI